MRKILGYALAVALSALAYGADQAASPKKAAATTAPARSISTPAAKKSPATAARRAPARGPVTTWRNRQVVPTPERYREIQEALAARGYLSTEEAANSWNQSSVDALKRFQEEQNIEASGKINSLSLIALGLGPKYDAAPAPRPAETLSGQDR